MYKKPFKYLFIPLITGVFFAGTLSGCREYGDPCPMGRQDFSLGNYEKSFMIYQGTETLVFIDLNHNRDTLWFKGTGIETGIDTSFITTNDNLNTPCIDTTFFEHTRIKFNQKITNDFIEYKISKAVHNNTIRNCLIITGQTHQYYLRLTSSTKDSILIDETKYNNVYTLYYDLDNYGEYIFFNKEYGILSYKDYKRNLIFKAVRL